MIVNVHTEIKQRFLTELRSAVENAPTSHERHYTLLDEFSKPIYDCLHYWLTLTGFINGGAALGLEQPPLAAFVWEVYGKGSSIYERPLCNGDHHASTYDRQRSWLGLIEEFQSKLTN